MALLYENDYIFRVRKMDKHWFSESDVTRFAEHTKSLIEEILVFHNELVEEDALKIIFDCLEKIIQNWPSYFFSQSVYTWLIRLEIHNKIIKLCSFFYGRWFYIENLEVDTNLEENGYTKVSSTLWDVYTIRL